MSQPKVLTPDPAYVRWAESARRRGRAISRVAPFTPPNVIEPKDLFEPPGELDVEAT